MLLTLGVFNLVPVFRYFVCMPSVLQTNDKSPPMPFGNQQKAVYSVLYIDIYVYVYVDKGCQVNALTELN